MSDDDLAGRVLLALPDWLSRCIPHEHLYPVLAVGRPIIGPCDFCGRPHEDGDDGG